MRRLFVDCDDTLVLWFNGDEHTEGVLLPGPNPYGGGAQRWKPNTALIEAIERVRDEYAEVIVWTGGGADYARLWRSRILPWAHDAIAKDTRLPFAGDLCIDDMPLSVRAPVQTWQEFVAGRPGPPSPGAGGAGVEPGIDWAATLFRPGPGGTVNVVYCREFSRGGPSWSDVCSRCGVREHEHYSEAGTDAITEAEGGDG